MHPQKKILMDKNSLGGGDGGGERVGGVEKKCERKKIVQTLQICIGPTIRIGRESWCLPYAGFLLRVWIILKVLKLTTEQEYILVNIE